MGRRRATIGGGILLVLGMLIVLVAIGAYSAPRVEGLDFGLAIAPFILVAGILPLATGLGVLLDHRSADVTGIIVGGLYGLLLLTQSTRGYGNAALAPFGLLFVGAAVILLDSLRVRWSTRRSWMKNP